VSNWTDKSVAFPHIASNSAPLWSLFSEPAPPCHAPHGNISTISFEISTKILPNLRDQSDAPQKLRPGLIAFLYKLRWDVEKVFDQLKNKLNEQKA